MPIRIYKQETTLAATANATKKMAEWLSRLSRNRAALDGLGDILAIDPVSLEPGRTIVLRYIGKAANGLEALNDMRRIQRRLKCTLVDYQAENAKLGRLTVNVVVNVPWLNYIQRAA